MLVFLYLFIIVISYKYIASPFIDGLYEDTFKRVFMKVSFLVVFTIFLSILHNSMIKDNVPVELTKKQRESEIIKITNELKEVPENEYNIRAGLYEKLKVLDASNEKYKKEFQYYNEFQILEQECGKTIKSDVYDVIKFPDTFETIGNTKFWVNKNKIVAKMNFKSKNAFGVPIRGTAIAECQYKDNHIEYKRLVLNEI